MKSSMEKTFYNFLYHTKLVSKHKEPIENIFKKLKHFLNNFPPKGEGGWGASVENSTNFITILI